MTKSSISVLLVEDDADDARLICNLLRDAGSQSFDVRQVASLVDAVEQVRHLAPDAILLDLRLTDSGGLETLTRMSAAAPSVPIIALTEPDDDALGVSSVRYGAQDHLSKRECDGKSLSRSIQYSIERQRADVDRRRELQDFIDAMSTLNAKVSPDGQLLIVNKIAQRSSGVPLEALLRTNMLDGHWWDADSEVRERVRTAFKQATDGALISFEERVVAFGSIITLHLTFVPVKAADGTVEYIVAEGRDISRRVEVEEALKEANQELEAFTYSVSHDLRAPIRQIDGFSRLLMEQFEPVLEPKARHFLCRIRDSTQHMGRLVDDLLRLAQVGRQDMRPRAASLNSLVEEVVADVQGDVADREIRWKIDPLPTVECDPGLMKVVLTNLVSNAVKYTRPRKPAVVEVGQTSRNGRPVIFVRDNGVGFDMRYADRLFGVFQRLHRADEFEGTGVGLATVQRIVHKHGGEIWAESEPDNGAAFYFTIGSGATTGSAL